MDKPEPTDVLLSEPLVIINVGLQGFAESLEEQEVDVVQVDWRPPAGGDSEMIDLLESSCRRSLRRRCWMSFRHSSSPGREHRERPPHCIQH